MAEPKEILESAIVNAKANLDDALVALEKMPAFDAQSVAFSAHALNNYLAVTTGTVELVLSRMAGHDDAQVRVWLEAVQHATHLMARVVGHLLNAAPSTNSPYRFESFDLATMVQRACSYYQRVADRKGIRLTLGPVVGVPLAWADRVAVAAVLDNLISNAIKYSPPGMVIDLEVRSEGAASVCAIRDHGPGLSPEDQAQLFQRGVKLTPRPTAGEPSTGYGLAVAKELVESQGGQIWCESAVEQGSCFAFRLLAGSRDATASSPTS